MMPTESRHTRLNTAREKGAAAVEFALILPIMILLVAGLVEFGRVMWHYDALAKGTRDGARLLSVVKVANFSTGVTNAQAAVVSAATGANVTGVTADKVAVRCDDNFDDAVDYACTDTRFTTASPPVRVSVGVSGYSMTVGAILPMLRQDGTAWVPFSLSLKPKTSMPYMR